MLLRSARLSIRPWTFHDDELADEWPPYNDPLEPLWNLPRQVGLSSEVWSFFESTAMRRTWAVDDAAGRMIGRISLRDIDTRKSQARLGITFGASYVGQGLGTEALALFLTYYFTDLGFQAMVLDVAAPNQRAVRSYERLGFSFAGSDWRIADSRFDWRVLDSPHYAQLRPFFRNGQHGLYVEFYEMQLHKNDWLRYARSIGRR
ncbi:MAG TPA: GNAT family N-acetyltransferase [Kouleothrix sp.]|uniref:GNAT family N-acetyltransferase n=1 Tax=Kouleothrix sp. TaxID=2779161 RepID=UPI002BDE17D0|nr:GNAT family N-acetyltransferase [Kouleothrix sp.]HRC76031.1 GNAT family N-acetyltransferase [Kouleothrix sp.]